MPGVFRRSWFPRRHSRGSIAPLILFDGIIESASATDSFIGSVNHVVSIVESITAEDTIATGATTFAGSLSEAAAASDSLSTTAAFIASLSGIATASDAPDSTGAFMESITEPATATDAYTTPTSGLINKVVEEVLLSGDSIAFVDEVVQELLVVNGTTTVTANGLLTETLLADPNVVSVGQVVSETLLGLHVDASLTEGATATDSFSAIETDVAALHEPAAAVDDIDAVLHKHPAVEGTPPIYATDVYDKWNPLLGVFGGFDFTIENEDLASHRDLVTSITVSLFCDRRAAVDDELPDPFSADRRGWWGDAFLVNDPNTKGVLGSRLWLLSRSKSYPQLPIVAKGYVQEALQWITDRGVASKVDIDTFFIANDHSKLGIVIKVYRRGQKPLSLTYSYVWDQVRAEPVY